MAAAGYPIVQREAWLYIATLAVAALALHHQFGWQAAVPLWLGVLAVAYLFRDPERDIPAIPLAVLSPADGHVLFVKECTDPCLNRDAVCVAIKMSTLGSYTTRSPVEGKVQERWHMPTGDGGARFGIWIRTDEDDDVVLVMNRVSAVSSPRCYVHSGERVGQGQRCGFIRFGSRVVVYLPVGSRVNVGAGSRVRAGADIIGTLIHKPAQAA